VLQHLQRTFWSLYGRFVWDAQNLPWKGSQVRQTVEMLQARRAMPGEQVLDAGCGTGDYAVALRKPALRSQALTMQGHALPCRCEGAG
jgi:2-polyprenyl-3-methyl-5-hydroxy-6-metoxy-1,4-benzoquinol methylase